MLEPGDLGKPSRRRACLGAPRPFDPTCEGQVVTLEGIVVGPIEVVAETHVSDRGILTTHRSRAEIYLETAESRILLDGPLGVVVGSHERERLVEPHGRVSFRELRTHTRVRARGRLRRATTVQPQCYRRASHVFVLCPPAVTGVIDLANEARPRRVVITRFDELMGEWDEAPAASPAVDPAVGLAALLHRRRSRS